MTIKTNLETKLQTLLDAVTGATSDTDMLVLAKASEGLDVDRTTFDAELQSRITALDGTESGKELLKVSKTIAPSISSGAYLAPDLTFPSSVGQTVVYRQVSGVNVSAGLTELLGLSGKFRIDYLHIQGMVAGTATVKLTVDGVVIWNDTYTSTTVETLLGGPMTTSGGAEGPILCNESLSLELFSATSTSAGLLYAVRPIL